MIILKLIYRYILFRIKVAEAYLKYLNSGSEYIVMEFPVNRKLYVTKSSLYKKAYNKLARKHNLPSIDVRDKLLKALYKTPSEGITRKSIKIKY